MYFYRDFNHDHGPGVCEYIAVIIHANDYNKKFTEGRKMKNKAMYWYLRGKMRCADALENFVTEERGDSNLVSIMVVIVIILAVAGVFRTQLMGAVNTIFTKLTEFIG